MGAGSVEPTGFVLFGIKAKTDDGVRGCVAGIGWKRRDIRRAYPSHFDLVRRKPVLFLASIAFLITLLVPFLVFSQVAVGTLSGTVTSESGSRIPNAQLSIRNMENGKSAVANGKEDGSYSVPNLVPGNYEVTASASGFVAARASVTVRAAADQLANFVLHPGNGHAASSTVSGVVNSQNVRELPLNRRSASDLAALEPGVATARTQSSGQGRAGQIWIRDADDDLGRQAEAKRRTP